MEGKEKAPNVKTRIEHRAFTKDEELCPQRKHENVDSSPDYTEGELEMLNSASARK